MFGDGLNPNYFQNPPAYTYLLHALCSIAYGVPPVGSTGAAIHQAFNTDPTTIYTIARVTSALMGIGAAWLLYFAGKRLYGTGVGARGGGVHQLHLPARPLQPLRAQRRADAAAAVPRPLRTGRHNPQGTRCSTTGSRASVWASRPATKYTAAALSVAIFVAWAIRVFDDRERGKREFGYLRRRRRTSRWSRS